MDPKGALVVYDIEIETERDETTEHAHIQKGYAHNNCSCHRVLRSTMTIYLELDSNKNSVGMPLDTLRYQHRRVVEKQTATEWMFFVLMTQVLIRAFLSSVAIILIL